MKIVILYTLISHAMGQAVGITECIGYLALAMGASSALGCEAATVTLCQVIFLGPEDPLAEVTRS